jgi:hypothetical protein
MLGFERKKVLHAAVEILLLMGFLICIGCDLTLGDDPIDGSHDNNCSSVEVERVSITSNGSQANGVSEDPSISSDGRFIAFISDAINLVSGDTNDFIDVFVHDRDTGNTNRVSVASDSTEANNNSFGAAISTDGRFVAFESDATNLVANDTNNDRDIFVHDRDTDVDGIFDEPGAISTVRVSVASNETEADDNSSGAAISSGGRFVAFESDATNLVLDDNNNRNDIFVHDRDTDEDGIFDEPLAISTNRVSVASDGTEADNNSFGAAISSDGRFVAFESDAANLVASDTNNDSDIFVHDRDTDNNGIFDEPGAISTKRVSVASDGTEADNNSFGAAISSDGRFVAFESDAANLVASDTNNNSDIFLHDRDTDNNGIFDEPGAISTKRVSVASDGTEADNDSFGAAISSDGRFVAFESNATNLVSQDTNGSRDVFMRDRDAAKTRRVSLAFNCSEGNNSSFSAVISGNGRFVAFESLAANLVNNDTNGFSDIFVIPNPLSP